MCFVWVVGVAGRKRSVMISRAGVVYMGYFVIVAAVIHLAASNTYHQEEWKVAEELRITAGINFKEKLSSQPTEGDGDKVSG